MALSARFSALWLTLATTLSGAAWWFGTGLHPMAWITWLAPLPLLLLAPRIHWQYLVLGGMLAGSCAGLNLWHYLRTVIGLPLPVGLIVAVVPALSFTLALLLFRRAWLARKYVTAAIAFPSLWVAIEYGITLGSPHGTFGSLAYSQLDTLPFIQVVSFTGIWGASFLLLLTPAALATWLIPGPDRSWRSSRSRMAAVSFLLVAIVFGLGFARLQAPATESMRVGLASMPGTSQLRVDSAEGQAMLRRYLAAIDSMVARGARSIVLPESVLAADSIVIPALAASATRHAVTITAGVAVKDATHGQRNMALAYLPTAPAPVGYAKHHLIPGLESQYRAGTGYAILPGTRTGLAVCKDVDFHDTARAYSDRGANLLLVPAWDFKADGRMHSRMAVMRGIENGFAVARAALNGNLTLSDDRGRIVAESSDAMGAATLVDTLPLHASRTLYARWGDWFAWLNLAMLAGALLSLTVGHRAR